MNSIVTKDLSKQNITYKVNKIFDPHDGPLRLTINTESQDSLAVGDQFFYHAALVVKIPFSHSQGYEYSNLLKPTSAKLKILQLLLLL